VINSVSLRNVRVFRREESNFRFGDLCIFCGTNSSGKSSVLKSLLLLRQSQGIEEPVRAQNGLLRFVGTQVDLGKFETFVSDRRTARQRRPIPPFTRYLSTVKCLVPPNACTSRKG